MADILDILLLEDVAPDALLVQHELKRSGFAFQAQRVDSREAFIAGLDQRIPDLILADYSLPSFDGLSALEITRALDPDVPFIFVSGAIGEERATEALKCGATDYVLKNRLERLGPTVRRALKEVDERKQRRAAEASLHEAIEELTLRAAALTDAYTELKESRAQLQVLSRRLVEVQEAERRAIALELHDQAGQALTSIKVGLRLLEQELNDPQAACTRIGELKRTTEGVMEGLHRLAVDLRPASLDKLGLVPALRQYVEHLNQQYGLRVATALDDLEGIRLDSEVETALYRIIQEALLNVVRHAGARQAGVIVNRRNGVVTAIVEDDGHGCDLAEAMHSGRLGLLGMRERAEMLGGSLTMESSPGVGTTVFATIPMRSHSEPR